MSLLVAPTKRGSKCTKIFSLYFSLLGYTSPVCDTQVQLIQAQEVQEEQDAVYEAKHNAKEGSNMNFKKTAPKKAAAAPKPKKAVEADVEEGDNESPAEPVVAKAPARSNQSYTEMMFLILVERVLRETGGLGSSGLCD